VLALIGFFVIFFWLNNSDLHIGDLMKTTNNLNCTLLVLCLFFIGVQQVGAATSTPCVAGSVTLKAPLYKVMVDASKLITYQQLIGNVTKKAVLRGDCVGYTTYTITGTKNLSYADQTQLVVFGKNDYNSPTPAAIFLTVLNGSIDKVVTAPGAQTGRNSDPLSIYLGASMEMRVKQPWQ
jgi:hypothetical protein